MTVSLSQEPFIRYTTNTNTFSVSFPRQNSNEVFVYAELLSNGFTSLLVEGTDYSIADVLPSSGNATITLIDAGQSYLDIAGNLDDSAYALIVEYSPIPRQETSFSNLGRFAPVAFEKVLDSIVMTLKSHRRALDRAFKVRRKDITDGANVEFGDLVASNTNKVLKVNSAGDGFDFGPLASTLASATGQYNIDDNTQVLGAGGQITIDTDLSHQVVYIQETSGAATLSTAPFDGTPVDGAVIVVVGRNTADALTIPASDTAGGVLGTNFAVDTNSSYMLIYNATQDRYYELSRKA